MTNIKILCEHKSEQAQIYWTQILLFKAIPSHLSGSSWAFFRCVLYGLVSWARPVIERLRIYPEELHGGMDFVRHWRHSDQRTSQSATPCVPNVSLCFPSSWPSVDISFNLSRLKAGSVHPASDPLNLPPASPFLPLSVYLSAKLWEVKIAVLWNVKSETRRIVRCGNVEVWCIFFGCQEKVLLSV